MPDHRAPTHMDTYDDDFTPDDSPRTDPQSGIVMSGTDLAKILGVGSSSLSQSARNQWQCRGFDVSTWAMWDGDRITSYDVPTDVVDRLTGPEAPDYPTSPPHSARGPLAATVRVPNPVAYPSDAERMQAPWMLPAGGYGTGFSAPAWPLVGASGSMPPAALAGAEQVTSELRRIIEDLHTQAERHAEDFERSRQALREDNERLRDELRRAQDQHAKEIRESERQLTKLREDAFEKRLALREKLLDAQTDARLAEGGVENSALERLIDRYGDSFGTIAGAVTTAILNRAGANHEEFEDDGEDALRGLPAGIPEADGSAVHVTAETIAQFILVGDPDEIEVLVAALRADVSGPDAYRLAGETVRTLLVGHADPAVVGARLRAVVADQFPIALSVPPSVVVQVAKTNGVVDSKAEANWLQAVVTAVQAPSAANASERS